MAEKLSALHKASDAVRPLTQEEILSGLQRNIEALRAEGDENARHVNALHIRIRDLERKFRMAGLERP